MRISWRSETDIMGSTMIMWMCSNRIGDCRKAEASALLCDTLLQNRNQRVNLIKPPSPYTLQSQTPQRAQEALIMSAHFSATIIVEAIV